MEQSLSLFEYRLGEEKFRFEAASEAQARQYRKYAMIHFMETLGHDYLESRLQGPLKVEFARSRAEIA